MAASFRRIRNGEPVNAPVTNRPSDDLARQIDRQQAQLDAAAAGRALILPDQACAGDVGVGQPVFWNQDENRFEKALASTALTGGNVQVAASGRVRGVVYAKPTATTADVCVAGLAAIDLTAAGFAEPDDGLYYLSAVTAGTLTRTRPQLPVQVLTVVGDGLVLVHPQQVEQLEAHTHIKIGLVCRPAGAHTEPGVGDPHVITSPNASKQGWLPAASFGGTAPEGAVFGYNLAAHPELAAIWPPLDLETVDLVLQKTDPDQGGQSVPLGHDGQCIVDRNGLWWTSDCYQDVPWPYNYESVAPTSYSDDDNPECPRHVEMTLTLWMTKLRFTSDLTAVTSLKSLDGLIEVVCADDPETAATVGRLALRLKLAYSVAAGSDKSAVALKTFTNGIFTQGPVCVGLYTEGENVILDSDATPFLLDPEDEDSPLVYPGKVKVSVLPETQSELLPIVSRLEGAEDNVYQGLPYLGFPKNSLTGVRMQFIVPPQTSLSTPKLRLRLRLIGRAAGSLPQLTVTGRRVARVTSPAAVPTSVSDFAVTVVTVVAVTANQYVDVLSDPFAVVAGDVVWVNIQRPASDGYSGEMGLMLVTAPLANS